MRNITRPEQRNDRQPSVADQRPDRGATAGGHAAVSRPDAARSRRPGGDAVDALEDSPRLENARRGDDRHRHPDRTERDVRRLSEAPRHPVRARRLRYGGGDAGRRSARVPARPRTNGAVHHLGVFRLADPRGGRVVAGLQGDIALVGARHARRVRRRGRESARRHRSQPRVGRRRNGRHRLRIDAACETAR